ncbi:MAG: protein of unknown function (DUF3054) [halophilic archaeon J07HB67]|jgi:Protein of unknown function (DUF3054).|nr:MAG: protein of unknown function (DUF3054) [halophilic archaeon J07HB67]
MAAASEFLDRRVDRGTLPLAVGDVLVILVFLYAGSLNHQTVGLPPTADGLVHLGGVAAPFLVGWVLVAVPIGAYSAGAGESAKASVPLAIRSWVFTAAVGLGLRATPLFPGGVELIFAGVVLGVGAVSLGVFRYVAGWLRG